MVNWLEETFPGLADSPFAITSPRDENYNCIAWAARDNKQRWWPCPDPDDEYWPPDVPREETLSSFEQAFAALGFTRCETDLVEAGVEKVAVFADDNSCPTHAARQLPSGRWTSKLGRLEDIEHDLYRLEGKEYGRVVRILSRPLH